MNDEHRNPAAQGGAGRAGGWAEGEEPLRFYYSRERRLASAPKIVQDYYSGKNKAPKGLIKVLVATPAKRMLFFSIIALCVVITFLSRTLPSASEATVAGIPAELSAFSFEDTVYISVRLGAANAPAQTVTAQIFAFNADNQLFETQVLEKNYGGYEEFMRTKVGDYDIIRVEAVLTASEQTKTLKSSIARK
jgi:hypothetical protein